MTYPSQPLLPRRCVVRSQATDRWSQPPHQPPEIPARLRRQQLARRSAPGSILRHPPPNGCSRRLREEASAQGSCGVIGGILDQSEALPYFGCLTTRKYGLSVFHPSGYFCCASSFDTAGTMMTSSPCFQFAGVATLCLAVSCMESRARRISSKLRPV